MKQIHNKKSKLNEGKQVLFLFFTLVYHVVFFRMSGDIMLQNRKLNKNSIFSISNCAFLTIFSGEKTWFKEIREQ